MRVFHLYNCCISKSLFGLKQYEFSHTFFGTCATDVKHLLLLTDWSSPYLLMRWSLILLLMFETNDAEN